MSHSIEIPLTWFWCAARCVGVAAFVLGCLGVVAPRQSIALYQWIMARLNWRVSPIDEVREVRNTRLLGGLLIFLSVVMAWLLRLSY